MSDCFLENRSRRASSLAPHFDFFQAQLPRYCVEFIEPSEWWKEEPQRCHLFRQGP